MKDAPPVQYLVTDGVVTIAMDRPEVRNALDDEMLDALTDAFARAKADAEVRVVVLTSSHPAVFSAGGNLRAFGDHRPPIQKYDGMHRFPLLYRDIAALGKPVICAANGHVLAGAFGLALACDLIIASETAQFGCPEVNIGAFPFMISALIYRNVGRMKANELMFLGDRIAAEEAQRLGIVNRVVSEAEFEEEVRAWSSRLASKSPLLMRMGKDAINATGDMHLEEALSHLQGQLALAFTTDDLHEGVSAFFDKRDPVWVGH